MTTTVNSAAVTEKLADVLRASRFEATLAQAELIRDWPNDDPDRRQQAVKLIREAMIQQAIGNITQHEESQIFTILSFAMPAGDPTRLHPYVKAV